MKVTGEEKKIPKVLHNCRQCDKPYLRSLVKRLYGKYSRVYELGYCCATCYTIDVTQ